MSEHHRTLCLVSEYLSELLRSGGTTGLDSEALEVAQQCIADLCATGPRASLKDYGLALPQVIAAGIAALKTQKSTTAAGAGSELQYSEAFLQYLGKLKESGYFGKGDVAEDSAEYKDRVEKAVNKWKSKYGSPYKGHDKEIVVEEVKEQVEVTEEDRKAAEELKASGNKKLAAGDYMGAIQCYSDAIKLNPQQAIYPANRAVAYIKMRKLEEAEKDCKTAIEVNPEYVKAYYRLGQVYHDLGNDEQALFTFEKGLEVAKKNGDSTMISSIQDEISRINELSNTQDSGAPNFDLGSIMSNPMFANLASQMMSNPGMMESMLGGMGGGAPAGPTDPKFKDTLDKMKDKPEFSALQEDPEVAAALADVQANGPSAMFKYMNNPSIMNKVMAALGKK